MKKRPGMAHFKKKYLENLRRKDYCDPDQPFLLQIHVATSRWSVSGRLEVCVFSSYFEILGSIQF